jgi:hypothetical protein
MKPPKSKSKVTKYAAGGKVKPQVGSGRKRGTWDLSPMDERNANNIGRHMPQYDERTQVGKPKPKTRTYYDTPGRTPTTKTGGK